MQESSRSQRKEYSLTEAVMSTEDREPAWYEANDDEDVLKNQVVATPLGTKKTRRRWLSLDTLRSDDSDRENNWIDKSRPTDDEKKRFNNTNSNDNIYDKNGHLIHDKPLLWAMSVMFSIIGGAAIVVTMGLTPLAQGGWGVNMPPALWAIALTVIVALSFAFYVLMTSGYKKPTKWVYFMAPLAAIISTILIVCLFLFIGSMVK